MTKAAVVAQIVDHPQTTVAHPLRVVAVHRTALPVAAADRGHHPEAAIQVLRETATVANNVIPADSSRAGAAVRATAAGPIPGAAIATAAAATTATAAATIAAIANHS